MTFQVVSQKCGDKARDIQGASHPGRPEKITQPITPRGS